MSTLRTGLLLAGLTALFLAAPARHGIVNPLHARAVARAGGRERADRVLGLSALGLSALGLSG